MLSKNLRWLRTSAQLLNQRQRNLSFDIPEEIKILQETCRNFAETELKPVASEIDQEGRFPAKQIQELGKLGLMGITVSSEYGGANLNTLAVSVVVEELSRACASTGAIVSIHNCLYANLLDRLGTSEQKQLFLKDFTGGEKLGAFALSESEAGSDVGAMKTIARKTGSDYVLNGTKAWVTSGIEGSAAIVFATIDQNLLHKGITAFLVNLDDPKVTRGPPEKKLGIRGSSTCDIVLDNLLVPGNLVLGKIGDGFKIAMQQLDLARIGIASQAVGIAQASLDLAIQYADQRRAFGQKLLGMPTIQSKIAEMSLKIETSRLLVWKAAALKDRNEKFTKFASLAKWQAGETANFCASTCVQILGGMGYVQGLPAERYYRDARITEIYGGATDIQKLIVAQKLIREYGLKV
jgi:butyryl-CoA dehydrogenase